MLGKRLFPRCAVQAFTNTQNLSVTGMTIASQLPSDYQITIVGKELPGDALTTEWASPWAGACWVGVHLSNAREQKLQRDSFAKLWKLAKEHPESGARVAKMTEILEYGSLEHFWYKSVVPDFKVLDKKDLPPNALFGVTYSTVCISPPIFLKWMRSRLEAQGVKFQRAHVESLEDLKHGNHDILINASGAQSKHLKDVADTSLVPFRLQSILIEADYDECYIYRGKNGYYFNMFGRGDGTTYLGGIKDLGSLDRTVYDKDRQTVS